MANTIYIVEDEPDLRDALVYNFKNEGFKVKSFANGESCLSKVNKKKPDLIILDIVSSFSDEVAEIISMALSPFS